VDGRLGLELELELGLGLGLGTAYFYTDLEGMEGRIRFRARVGVRVRPCCRYCYCS
jgi:hypothetical protein